MIRVEQLTKTFGNHTAVDGVTRAVARQESLAVLGPSGSGKTTLLRLIAGLEKPDRGEIFIGDRVVSSPLKIVAPHKRGIGFVFQEPSLWPHLTVAQNILFGLQRLSQPEARKRLVEVLEQTNLTGFENRFPDEISGGEARRVAIARAVAPRPACLLMDEPLINLDPELKERMMGIIRDVIENSGATLIYVTHDRPEAVRISGRIIELRKGRIVGEVGGKRHATTVSYE